MNQVTPPVPPRAAHHRQHLGGVVHGPEQLPEQQRQKLAGEGEALERGAICDLRFTICGKKLCV